MHKIYCSLVIFIINTSITILLIWGSIAYWRSGLSGKMMLGVFILLVAKGFYKGFIFWVTERPQIIIGRVDDQGNEKTIFIMRPNGQGGNNVY